MRISCPASTVQGDGAREWRGLRCRKGRYWPHAALVSRSLGELVNLILEGRKDVQITPSKNEHIAVRLILVVCSCFSGDVTTPVAQRMSGSLCQGWGGGEGGDWGRGQRLFLCLIRVRGRVRGRACGPGARRMGGAAPLPGPELHCAASRAKAASLSFISFRRSWGRW